MLRPTPYLLSELNLRQAAHLADHSQARQTLLRPPWLASSGLILPTHDASPKCEWPWQWPGLE